jgi:hypothetical protein
MDFKTGFMGLSQFAIKTACPSFAHPEHGWGMETTGFAEKPADGIILASITGGDTIHSDRSKSRLLIDNSPKWPLGIESFPAAGMPTIQSFPKRRNNAPNPGVFRPTRADVKPGSLRFPIG